MSSFFFPHSADALLSSLDRGLLFDSGGTDFGETVAMFTDQFQSFEDYSATQATTVLDGTLDGGGAATVAHLIGQPFGLLAVQAWCKGATATDFSPVTVDSVDDTNVVLSGGTAAAPVRVFLQYSIGPPGW